MIQLSPFIKLNLRHWFTYSHRFHLIQVTQSGITGQEDILWCRISSLFRVTTLHKALFDLHEAQTGNVSMSTREQEGTGQWYLTWWQIFPNRVSVFTLCARAVSPLTVCHLGGIGRASIGGGSASSSWAPSPAPTEISSQSLHWICSNKCSTGVKD